MGTRRQVLGKDLKFPNEEREVVPVLLRLLAERGGRGTSRDVTEAVAEHFRLSPAHRQVRTSAGDLKYIKMVSYSRLKCAANGLLVRSEAGQWVLSSLGMHFAAHYGLGPLTTSLKVAVDALPPAVVPVEWDEDAEHYPEGEQAYYLHLRRERNRQLVEDVRARWMAEGELRCEVCEFDFAATYGKHGAGYIECHHLKPLAGLPETGGATRPDDMARVCANCHRMLHRGSELLTPAKLRSMLRPRRRSA